MPDWLVCDGELTKVVTNHLRLYLNANVLLAIINTHNAPNHLWHNNHVPQMGLYGFWLFTISSLSLCFAQLLEQCNWLPFDASAELAALPCPEQLHEVLIAQVEQLVQVNAAEGILAEGAFLWLIFITHRGNDWLKTGNLCESCGQD